MSSRSNRSHPQRASNPPQRATPPPTRRPGAAVKTRPAARAPETTTQGRQFNTQSLPIDIHRAIASVALVLMLLVPLFAPLGTTAPDPAPFITPRIDGSGSVAPGFTGADVEQAIFPYLTVIERNQGNISSAWPEASEVMAFDPSSRRAREAIIGQIYASTSGGLGESLKIRNTGLLINPPGDMLANLEQSYFQMLNKDQTRARGINGLAAMSLVRSITAPLEQRADLELAALIGTQNAITFEPQTWQLTYNWSLANLVAGNYASAYAGLKAVRDKAASEGNALVTFWMGLAALRVGDPGQAILDFRAAIDAQAPPDANDDVTKQFEDTRSAAREGLSDAQWANRDPATAYQTYYNSLLADGGTSGLYAKWLRLALQQRGYERLVADMASLEANSSMGKDARIYHDRARVLSLLGRQSEADAEYKKALDLGESDPGLLVSYGQALESRGGHDGAVAVAEQAIRKLGKDPANPDLSGAATVALMPTALVADQQAAQQLLDANLLRARAWGKQDKQDQVSLLVQHIVQAAASVSANEAGLLNLYGAFAYEAAGMADKASGSYSAAWDKLNGLPSGSPGRGAALAGLARTTAAAKDAAAGLAALKSNGYDPAAPKPSVASDRDAPDILYQGAVLLRQAGQAKEAANAQRVASITRNIQDVRSLTGVGRPIWVANGTQVPATAALAAADSQREAGDNSGLAVMRYRQAFGLDPALAAAWNNLGVLYAKSSDPADAQFYLSSAGKVSPGYALGQHNLAALAYKGGPGNFFTAEAAQGEAVKAAGPQSLSWGYDVRADDRGPLPTHSIPRTEFLTRIPALIIIALLLAHTLVRDDRLTNRMGLLPTKGIIGTLGTYLDERAKAFAPSLVRASNDSRALLWAIAIPSVIGMLGLAWGVGHGSFEVALVFLPVALIAALVAFGANELGQRFAARRDGTTTLHHIWPLGVLLGILSIPFGFVYGWQNVTRVQPKGDTQEAGGSSMSRSVVGRRARSSDAAELAYEAQAEAAAEETTQTPLGAGRPVGGAARFTGLSPVAGIFFAGLAANLVIGLLFGVAYWLTGWPSMRLAMFAAMLVLAFTSVSEPPADGWTLYRRNASLWLALFAFAALMVTLLSAGVM